MEGYWLIWCIIILFILYTSGFKHVVKAYITKQELLIYVIVAWFWLSNSSNVLYAFDDGHGIIYYAILLAFIPLVLAMARYRLSNVGIMILTGTLLGLFYCLYLSIFLIFRGYEPSMLEWLVYVMAINLLLLSIISRKQLLLVIIIAQIVGEWLVYWHQKGQYVMKLGAFDWWEFSLFLFVSTICLYESLLFIMLRVKLIANNKMKS